MSKQPFLPLFFGDFLASTAEWSGEEASLYLTLLGHQWTLGTLPSDPAKLARLVRWDRKAFDKCWPQVSGKFEQQGGRLVNARLEQHRAKSDELAEKNRASGRKGAEARWRKDGERHSGAMANAIEPLCHLSHPIPSHPEVLPPSPPEPDVSASPAQARARDRNELEQVSRETNSPRLGDLVGPAVNREALEEWRQHRSAKGKPLAAHELIVLGKTLASWGAHDVQLATVRNCIANGWMNLRQSDAAPVRTAAANAAAEAGLRAWEALIASDGARRDARAQRALDAVGGWLAVKGRDRFTERDLRDRFARAYALADEVAA